MENLFEYYIENSCFHLKYAQGEPALKEQEFHDYNEVVLFIRGKSFFVSKNIQQNLSCKSIIIIPKEQFHQFRVEYPDSYVRCILGFRTTPQTAGLISEVMDKIKIISEPDVHIVRVFEQLIEIIKSELSYEEKIMYINSSIVQLLIHLKQNSSIAIDKNINLSPVTIQAISLIDDKYTEKLSVQTIAEELYVSASTLAHKFSKEMNMSVYQYIIKKRISAAQQLIEQGEYLHNAALRSGFNDYSSFYRASKKYNNK